jgi:hypothetical protein
MPGTVLWAKPGVSLRSHSDSPVPVRRRCYLTGALDSFATHQDRAGAWVSVVVGGHLIVRGFIRR